MRFFFHYILRYFVWIINTGKRRYNIKLWKTFTDCFNCLPVAAIVDEKIFCMHGGLSPELNSMEQIKSIVRPTDVPGKKKHEGLGFKFIIEELSASRLTFFSSTLMIIYRSEKVKGTMILLHAAFT